MKNNLVYCFIACCFCSGCLKEDKYFDKPVASPVIRISNSNWPLRDFYGSPVEDSVFGTTALRLYAGIAFEKPLDKEVKVIFVKDNSIAGAYNAAWGTSYQPLPDNCYSMNSLELTIPAGSMNTYLPITLIPSNFNGVDDYILTFSIQSATDNTIAENFKSMVFTLKGY